jgi:hypothetical protein
MVEAQSPEWCLFALSLLPLAGCHVFETAEVACTSDLPCARRKDTEEVDDTGDTGEDPGTPIVGWVTSMVGPERGIVRVFDPVSAEITAEWRDLGQYTGAAYYDAATGTGILVGADAILALHPGGISEYYGEGTNTDRFDVSHLGNRLIVALDGGVVSVTSDLATIKEVVPFDTFVEIAFLGGNQRVAFFVDNAEGGPDLWKLSPGSEAELVGADYDTSTSRGTNVFVGPADRPYACDTSGGIYAVDDLMAGTVKAITFVDGDVDDVASCAWDPGDDSWLAWSPSQGVFRVSAAGETTQVYAVSTGYDYDQIYWYGD